MAARACPGFIVFFFVVFFIELIILTLASLIEHPQVCACARIVCMKFITYAGFASTLVFISITCASLAAQEHPAQSRAPRIYIEPQEKLDSFLAAAIIKKRVPVIVTQKKADAQFVLIGGAESKDESGAAKVLRCLAVYCYGINGSRIVTVRLVDNETQEVVWADNVTGGSSRAYRSTAEAVAKHLKHYLEEHPR